MINLVSEVLESDAVEELWKLSKNPKGSSGKSFGEGNAHSTRQKDQCCQWNREDGMQFQLFWYMY